MTMVIVMRHGPWNHREDCLKDEGWEKAKQVAKNLLSLKRVIVAPKKRCRDTARALGFKKFEINHQLDELFPDHDSRFAELSKKIGAYEALFGLENLRRNFEQQSCFLFSRLILLKESTLCITHGELLCGLSLILEGKRNWSETEWKDHLFRPFGILKMKEVQL